ncbi:hypothetical protein L210DRAFT_3641965 [Boletus edulis BED1]|uniref:Arrestin C-terminal-like domain-containing protein n=1 Tax=Boletus edulis BED1 TaxID=1328754 RepID=A0AAD4C1G7_BOLED|nr:hypothetical protein L210DRAFT_3641965 [Boletus edulis BED1]
MSLPAIPQRQDRRLRTSILLAPDLSTIPSSTLVTSTTTSSFILPHIDRSGTLPSLSDAAAYPSNQYPNSLDLTTSTWLPSLRSVSSMRGLLLAEMGDSTVEMDLYAQPGSSGYRVGQRIEQGFLTPGGSTLPSIVGATFEMGKEIWREDTQANASPSRKSTWRGRRGTLKEKGKAGDDVNLTPRGVGLSTSDTLLQISAPPHKSTSELRILLGNSAFRLKRNASVIPPVSFHRAVSSGALSTVENDDLPPDPLALEKAKPRARVEVDIVLESETCVQGSALKGHITIHVRKNANKKQNTPILLSKAKVRVVGYEAIPNGNTRCTFYQCTALLSHVAPAWDSVLASPPDEDGWAEAKEGIHVLPFSLTLPADGMCGIAKGTLNIHSGVALRYFAMASLMLKDPETSAESVAHFYRSCEIWPRLSFASKLAPAPRPLVSETAKTVFMGGSGKVRLSAAMHRLYWVAGQRCVVHLRVVNESKKTVKGASITLLRTTTVFKPLAVRKGNPDADPDACETMTMRKVVAASVLVMGQKCTKGHASAKGWWTGVRPGDTTDFVHHIVLPSDALSVSRVRLLEVEYTLNVNVTTGGLSSDVEATLPIRIINFLSIDPPPTSAISHLHGRLRVKPQLGRSDTWYRKSRCNKEVGETVPGMKYSSTDMTVVAQEGEVGSVSQGGVFVRDASGDSSSVYPPSDSTGTITQRLNVTASLDEIDHVIGTDSRIHNFVTEAGRLTGSGSMGSRLGLRAPRGPRLAPPPEAITPPNPRQESTPRKHPRSNTLPDRVQEREKASKETVPFIGRQPSITRASSMLVARTGADEDFQRMTNRSKSEFLITR